MSTPIRVAVVEDHAGLRERLVQQLAFYDHVEVVLVSESGDGFLADLAVRGRTGAPLPDVVLMDIEMPGRDGIETTAEVTKAWAGMEVLILTVYEDEDKIFAAVQAGASGYLLKDAGPDAVVRAVQEIAQGGAPTSPLVARKLLGYVRQQQAADRRSAAAADALRLTPRETDVLSRLVEDDTEAAIADALGVSPHTVRSHVKNLYAKLQVHSRAQAVRAAFERGLV
ncbi:response regulator [Rubrivirga sp.]|uniref:response regulator transcription factor n=1 Tax=Rubrivirga sp. TaxID=1885344 RepID=UPI003B52076F